MTISYTRSGGSWVTHTRRWIMYTRKPEPEAAALLMYGSAERENVRYSVLCDSFSGDPVLFPGTDLIPHSAEARDPNRKFIHIASPRNVRFAPEDMDQDPRQWSRTAMPADKFFELYEPEKS